MLVNYIVIFITIGEFYIGKQYLSDKSQNREECKKLEKDSE